MMLRRHLAVLLLSLGLLACSGAGLVAQEGQGLSAPTILQGMEPDREDLDLRTTPVVRAVRQAADSVVSIYVIERGASAEQLEGQGSGVIVDSSGLVITNWHVVAHVERAPQRRRLQVRLKDDRRLPARLVSTSPEHDLALLQLVLDPGETVQPVVAGRSESLMIGETVVAIGNPQGHANTVTVGVLSAIDRSIHVRTPDGTIRDYGGLLQTDAAINRGNSGGALLDITGKLIGINNAMQQGVENIGFAIPVDTVKRVFDDVLARADNLATVWIGLRVDDSDGAVVVTEVFQGGPADRAGVREGDRITALAGRTVDSALDFHRLLATMRTGRPTELELRRDGSSVVAEPTVFDAFAREIATRAGLELEVLTVDENRELLRKATLAFYSGRRGRVPMLPAVLRVRSVYPDSPGAELGFREGDLVLGTVTRDPFFGNRRSVPFRSLEDFADWLRTAAARRADLFLIVMRDGEILEGELSVRADREGG